MSTEYPLLDLQSIPSFLLSASEHLFFATITPEIAEKILDVYNYDLNRPINKRKVSELASFMREGTFQPLTSVLNFSLENGKVKLVDGQHRMSAQKETNKTYSFPILVTTQNANDIYPKIDRGKPRTLKDAVRSNQTAHTVGLSESATIKAAVGLKVILNGYIAGGSYYKEPPSEQRLLKTLTEEYKEEANRIFEMIDHLELAKKLSGRLPMSMFLALYKELPKPEYHKVDEFIYGCGTNIGLGEGDVRRFIYAMYSTMVRKGGHRGSGGKAVLTSLEEISTLLICWEYWYQKKTYGRRFSEAQRLKLFKKKPNLIGTTITYGGWSPIDIV